MAQFIGKANRAAGGIGASEKPRLIVAACRQTAAFIRKIELSGFLPKAATPGFQWS
jgi:hypothetical protein